MRLEHIPLIIGAIVALIGLGLIADGLMAESGMPATERRRRMRTERNGPGEAIVGVGILCMAAALIGRDTWRYGTVAVLVGAAIVLIGVILNRGYLKEALLFRGPARRGDPSAGDVPHTNRSTRLGAKAPVVNPQSSRLSPRTRMAAGGLPTPVTPTRALEARPVTPARGLESRPVTPTRGMEARPRTDTAQPSENLERRQTPRGKR
jgi:hypothetical protein